VLLASLPEGTQVLETRFYTRIVGEEMQVAAYAEVLELIALEAK